jgi:hypothetical protein
MILESKIIRMSYKKSIHEKMPIFPVHLVPVALAQNDQVGFRGNLPTV